MSYSGYKHQKGEKVIANWLRVFRSADASRIGEGERQQGHTKAVRSEKCGAFRGTM